MPVDCAQRQFALFPTIYFFANHCKVCVPFFSLLCMECHFCSRKFNSRQQTSSCSLPENFQLGKKMDKNSRVPVCVYFRKLSLSPLCAKNSSRRDIGEIALRFHAILAIYFFSQVHTYTTENRALS